MFAPHAPAVPAASVCTPGCRFMVPVTARNSENVGPLPVGDLRRVRHDARGAWGCGSTLLSPVPGVVRSGNSEILRPYLDSRRGRRLSVEHACHILGRDTPKFRESLPLPLVRVLVQPEELMIGAPQMNLDAVWQLL